MRIILPRAAATFAVSILVITVGLPSTIIPAGGSTHVIEPGGTDIVSGTGHQTEDDGPTSEEGEIPGLGSIIGSPEAGPDPEDAGDRGGWAQLGLAAVMFAGVGFIMRKIFKEASRPAGP